MDQKISYSREEVIAAGSNLPTRGLLCQECDQYIPVFEDLSEEDEQSVRQGLQQHTVTAMKELIHATGCSLEWAKLGAHHGGKPTPPKKLSPVTTAANRCEHHSPNSAAFAGATGTTKTMWSL